MKFINIMSLILMLLVYNISGIDQYFFNPKKNLSANNFSYIKYKSFYELNTLTQSQSWQISNLRTMHHFQQGVVYEIINDGGSWLYDAEDSISADNEGTVLVTQNGKRLKRIFDVVKGVNIEWFGGSGDGKTDNAPAFEKAKAALPNGGTINFGKGIYTSRKMWMINKSNIFFKGVGADKTILTADSSVDKTFSICPVRTTDSLFIQGNGGDTTQLFPFKSPLKKGDNFIELKDNEWANEFPVGQEIFIRGGAHYYDQEFGELNIVTKKERAKLYLQYPLSRNYSVEQGNWQGLLLQDFTPPKVGGTAVAIVQNPPTLIQRPYSLGNEIYILTSVTGNAVTLLNPGRGNSNAVIPAGTYVAKGRQIIKSFHTQNFRMEGVTIMGQQARVFTADNSMHTYIKDCIISRNIPRGTTGGFNLTVDCTRDVTFDHVVFTAPDNNPSTAQISRSSGNITFKHCTFKNVPTDFSEFCFNIWVDSCNYDITGKQYAARLGKSTTYCKITNTAITMQGGMTAISMDDIQAFKNSQRVGSLVNHCTFNLKDAGMVIQNMGDGKNEFLNNTITGSFGTFCNTLRDKKKIQNAANITQLSVKNNKVYAAIKGFLFNFGDADIENNEFNNTGIAQEHALCGIVIYKSKADDENDITNLILKNNTFQNWSKRTDKIQVDNKKNISSIQIENNVFN